MAKDRLLAVALPTDVPILEDLITFAAELAKHGETARVIGGVAITIWGLSLNRPRGVATNDIDAVIPRQALADATSIKTYAHHLRAAAAKAGYTAPEKPTSAQRFAFLRAIDRGPDARKIELLSGESSLGRKSTRPPPARHLVDDDGLRLTVAVNSWLDLLPEPWIGIDARRGVESATLDIPSCPALAVLKVRAVLDKQTRVDAEEKEARRDYEIGRLARHLDDLLLIRDWIEGREEIRDLRTIADGDQRIRQGSRSVERWFLESDDGLVNEVFRRTPRLRRGLPDVRAALEI